MRLMEVNIVLSAGRAPGVGIMIMINSYHNVQTMYSFRKRLVIDLPFAVRIGKRFVVFVEMLCELLFMTFLI